MLSKITVFILSICTMLIPSLSSASECENCTESNTSCFTDPYGVIYCNGVLVSYPEDLELVTYQVDARAHIIGEGSFSGNEYFQEVFIPNGVVMIGEYAFEGCTALRTVQLPDSLLVISSNAFSVCTSLDSILLPGSIHCIGSQAFCDTWSLEQVILPETLRFIGEEAFAHSGVQEAYIYSVHIECGYDVFTPSSLRIGNSLRLHFREDVFFEEMGNVYSWIEELQQDDNIVIVFDIPYEE